MAFDPWLGLFPVSPLGLAPLALTLTRTTQHILQGLAYLYVFLL